VGIPDIGTLNIINKTVSEIMGNTFVIGDIHGEYEKLVRLLKDAGLVGEDLAWTGKDTVVWFMGDFVDRGPDGIAVIDLVMRLQQEAADAGGRVASLLGNHELLLLAAHRFGRRSTGLGSNFLARWKRNGGKLKDIARLTRRHLNWLARLPLMARVGDCLLVHADAAFYLRYGHSVDEVNAALNALIDGGDALAWEELIEDFARRGVFHYSHNGQEFVHRFLDSFGGRCVVHGHTPISTILGCSARKVTDPLVYAKGRCINVDGGMCLGGPGFVYQPL
jgi:hypothetical protein